MKKFSFILATALIVASIGSTATAQLTTGSSTAKNIRTGNRASEGDFGLYFGVTLDYLKNVAAPGISPTFLPIVNLKYMYSDNLELRIGIDLNKYKEKVSASEKDKDANKTYKLADKEDYADIAIYPGVAYHFAKTNILDVYAGGELPLGYKKHTLLNQWDGSNGYQSMSRVAYNVGLGGFIGLQAYIANLPIAVGFEYGLFVRWDLGLKYKNKIKANAESDPVVSYSTDPSSFKNIGGYVNMDKMNAHTNMIGNQLRLTITYFFHNTNKKIDKDE